MRHSGERELNFIGDIIVATSLGMGALIGMVLLVAKYAITERDMEGY